MVAASMALGFLSPGIIPGSGKMLATNGDCNFLAPLLMLGVCVAELRYHLSATAKAVLGHWLVVDASIIAFIVLTFAPLPGTFASYGQNTNLSALPNSVAISATQQILFCLVLLCLSCQAH